MGDDTSVVVLDGEKTVGESVVKNKAAAAAAGAPVPHAEPIAAATRKRKAGQEVPMPRPPVGEAKAGAKPGTVGLVGGVKLEDLAPAVRTRMDEVLQKGEDDEMRQDVRLINFLGEVEEAQVTDVVCYFTTALLLWKPPDFRWVRKPRIVSACCVCSQARAQICT